MRPTLLQFISTKEKTPASYYAKNTYDGRNLSFSSPKGDSKRSSFNCEKRFIAYDILSKRTGYRVGPGSYSPELYRPRIRSGSPYRSFHLQKDTANNGYFMVGDSLEFEPKLMNASSRRSQNDKVVTKDTTYLFSKSIKTASSTVVNNNSRGDSEGLPDIKRRLSAKVAKGKKVMKSKKKKKNMEQLLRKRFKC